MFSAFTPAVAAGGVLVGAGATITAVFADASGRAAEFGMMTFLSGAMLILSAVVCRQISRTNRPADHAFHEGYEMGYDKGWTECRRADTPQLVSLPTGMAVAND